MTFSAATNYTPELGDAIVISSPQTQSNGNDGVCAGVVTQPFPNSFYANVTVFPPFMTPQHLGSVLMFRHEAAAREMLRQQPSMTVGWAKPVLGDSVHNFSARNAAQQAAYQPVDDVLAQIHVDHDQI